MTDSTKQPMTFDEWYEANHKLHGLDNKMGAYALWEASTANQSAIVAELVEALDNLVQVTQHLKPCEETMEKSRALLAKLRG